MKQGRSSMFVKTAGAALLASIMAAPAMAEEAAGPNTGKVSLSAGVDIVTNYIFRGIAQQNDSIIAQPYAYVSFNLYEGEDVVNNVALTFGIWNSFQEANRGNWYEADLSAGIDVTMFEKLTAGLSYIWYQAPNGAFTQVQEVDLKLSFDDSGIFPDVAGQPLSFAPYVLFAFEVQNGNDRVSQATGLSRGTYMEAGIAPSFTIDAVQDYPVTITIPVAVGISLDDYYQNTVTDDESFGFVMTGVKASVPLAFIPADYGSWNFNAGLLVYFVGDSVNNMNGPTGNNVTGGDDVEFVGTFGVSMSY